MRSPREIRKMRAAGLVVWQAHQGAYRALKVGVTTAELNEIYRQTFAAYDATPLFLGYGPEDCPFPAETCISINEELVHGIPGPRKVKTGDIISLDTGCSVDRWCGDAAVTFAVGEISSGSQRLLDVTEQSLNLAIEMLDKKLMWSEVAREMQAYVEDNGFGVVRDLTGHGIGQKLHEPPQAPNYWDDQFDANDDFDIRPGLVFACEPMVTEGTYEVDTLDDDWTMVTADGKLCAHFEHTIAITKEGPIRLTGPPSEEELELVPEEFRDSSQWAKW